MYIEPALVQTVSHIYYYYPKHYQRVAFHGIYDIPDKKLILKLMRTVRKRLGRGDRIGQGGRYGTPLYIGIITIAYMGTSGYVPHKDIAKPKGGPRAKNP